MTRVVLILPTATYRAEDFVRSADQLGIDITVASEDELPLSPAKSLVIDCAAPEKSAELIVAHADTHRVDCRTRLTVIRGQ